MLYLSLTLNLSIDSKWHFTDCFHLFVSVNWRILFQNCLSNFLRIKTISNISYLFLMASLGRCWWLINICWLIFRFRTFTLLWIATPQLLHVLWVFLLLLFLFVFALFLLSPHSKSQLSSLGSEQLTLNKYIPCAHCLNSKVCSLLIPSFSRRSAPLPRVCRKRRICRFRTEPPCC